MDCDAASLNSRSFRSFGTNAHLIAMRRFLTTLLILLSVYCYGQETLKVGVISYKSDEKVVETFEPIFSYIASELDRKLELTIVPEDDLAFHLHKNDFDLGIFTIFPYLRAKEDFPGLHVFASHKVSGEESFHGVILAKKSSGIIDLHELQGKKFLFVKPSSTSGYKYPKGIFTESDMDIDNNFFSFDFSYDHNQSLDSLRDGAVDGIAIDESYFLKREDINKEDFQVLARYEVPYHAYVTAPDMSTELHDQLEEIMFSAHKNPKAKKLFNNPLEVTSLVPKNDEYYNIIRRYLRITRVKPMLDLHIRALGMAAENLEKNGDVLKLIEDKVVRGLLKTKRFSEPQGSKKQYFEHVLVNIYQVNEDVYHYQVLFNDHVVDEGADITDAQLRSSLHEIIRKSVLEHLPIATDLLYNGRDWFINYGRNDGLTKADYLFDVIVNGKSTTLKEEDIEEMTELNTHFADNELFRKGATVEVRYKVADKSAEAEPEDTTINIFSAEFWKTSYWDKLGLIIGILLTIVSAMIGGFFRKRKKQKFKGLLDETNELIKECVGDHMKMQNKIITQKEKITTLLESGKITENQYLILKNRLVDLQNIFDNLEPKNIKLSDEQKEQIEQIVSDGKINEKEFLKITNILKNRGAELNN